MSRSIGKHAIQISGQTRRTGRWWARTAAMLGAAVLITTMVPVFAIAAAASPMTLWGAAPDASPVLDADSASVELGTSFVSTMPGTVIGVKFWKTPENTGIHVGHLWGPTGKLLATAKFTNETESAWQTVTFNMPIVIKAHQKYVVSYHAPHGRYVATTDFSGRADSSVLSVQQGKSGVYSYGKLSKYPSSTWHSSQYWVDVLFVPSGTSASPEPTARPTTKPKPTASATPKPSPSATPTPTGTATRQTGSSGRDSAAPAAPAAPAPAPAPAGNAAQASIGKGWALTSSTVGLTPFGLSCSELPAYKLSGNTVPAGTTIYRQRIIGWLDLSLGNITISQSCVQPRPGEVGQGSTALTTWSTRDLQGPVIIQDSEYDGSLLNQHDQAWINLFSGAASMYRNYIHNSGSGISIQGSYEKTGQNIIIQNNYVDHLVAYGDASGSGNHQSAFTVRDTDLTTNPNRQLLVKDNYLNATGGSVTGSFFIQPNGDNVSNVTAQGNYLGGEGFNLILQDDRSRFPGVSYHNMRATDNRFHPTEYGPTSVTGTGEGWTTFTNNSLYNPSAADGKGTTVTTP